jgi:hypothetical protein
MGGGKNVQVSTAGLSILGNRISDEKLKQKGFFHSVDLFDKGLLCTDFKQELLIHPCR